MKKKLTKKGLTTKRLTTKEKILISLEEKNDYRGRMIGGFISTLAGVSSVTMSTTDSNGLLNLEEIKGR